MMKHALISLALGICVIGTPQVCNAGFLDSVMETAGVIFGDTNPYEEYKDGDSGLIGYMFWHTIAKTPKAMNGYLARKALPYNGLIDIDDLQTMEFSTVSYTRNLILPDQYMRSDSGSFLWSGTIGADDSAAGYGVLATKEHGTIIPIYAGHMENGMIDGYGIKYGTVENDYGLTVYVEYEGEFWHHLYDGNGVLYEVDKSQLGNSIPNIKTFSGRFSKGKKDGYFFVYDEDNLEYEGTYSDDVRS